MTNCKPRALEAQERQLCEIHQAGAKAARLTTSTSHRSGAVQNLVRRDDGFLCLTTAALGRHHDDVLGRAMMSFRATTLCAVAVSGFAALAASAPSHALTAQECRAKYQEARRGGTLGDQKWNDFRKAQCGPDATTAAAPAAPAASKQAATPAAPGGPAVFPTAIDP